MDKQITRQQLIEALSKQAFVPLAQPPAGGGGTQAPAGPQGAAPAAPGPQGAAQGGQSQVDPNTGMPVDPNTGLVQDPSTGMLIDPATGTMIDPNTMQPIDPNTGMPTNSAAQQAMPGEEGASGEGGEGAGESITIPLEDLKTAVVDAVRAEVREVLAAELPKILDSVIDASGADKPKEPAAPAPSKDIDGATGGGNDALAQEVRNLIQVITGVPGV